MDASAFRHFDDALESLMWALLIAVPLAAWKVIDIVLWLLSHVQVRIV
jgi:hypothetical protein